MAMQKPMLTPTLIGKLIDRSVALVIACVMLWLVWEKMGNLEQYIRDYIRQDHAEAVQVIRENSEVTKKLIALLEERSQ